jgi:hypothetical protein
MIHGCNHTIHKEASLVNRVRVGGYPHNAAALHISGQVRKGPCIWSLLESDREAGSSAWLHHFSPAAGSWQLQLGTVIGPYGMVRQVHGNLPRWHECMFGSADAV